MYPNNTLDLLNVMRLGYTHDIVADIIKHLGYTIYVRHCVYILCKYAEIWLTIIFINVITDLHGGACILSFVCTPMCDPFKLNLS